MKKKKYNMACLLQSLSSLPKWWRYILVRLLVTLLIVLIFLFHYLFTATYTLERLKLRSFSLPNFQCNHCNNFTVNYLVHEKAKCDLNEDVFLLNVLISSPSNVRARKLVRENWGSVKEYHGLRVKTIFVFGVHAEKNFNKLLELEQEKYGDVVQGNCTDDYNHLTEKTMMALDWISQFCPQTKYVLKTDDDSFNHPHRIIDYLMNITVNNFVGGHCFELYPPIRNKNSKWHVLTSQYPAEVYPTYCSGAGYILSQGAIEAIIRVAPNVAYLGMEDVYVTGMARETAKIQYNNIPGILMSHNSMSKCELATFAKNAHWVAPENQAKLWNLAVAADAARDCQGLTKTKTGYALVCLLILLWIILYRKRRADSSHPLIAAILS